jgi:hypothetical protein
MKGYAETEIFTADEMALHQRATALVASLAQLAPEEQAKVRCHELARAVGRVLGLEVQDGRYGACDHSWCWTAPRPRGHVLEVYAIARVPMVQLVDHTALGLPEHLGYRPFDLATLKLSTPIDDELINRMVRLFVTGEWYS